MLWWERFYTVTCCLRSKLWCVIVSSDCCMIFFVCFVHSCALGSFVNGTPAFVQSWCVCVYSIYLVVYVWVYGCCLHAQLGLRRLNDHVVHIVATRRCGPHLRTVVWGDVLFRSGNKNRQRQGPVGFRGLKKGKDKGTCPKWTKSGSWTVLTEMNAKRGKRSLV